jgi:hypothetical protein
MVCVWSVASCAVGHVDTMCVAPANPIAWRVCSYILRTAYCAVSATVQPGRLFHGCDVRSGRRGQPPRRRSLVGIVRVDDCAAGRRVCNAARSRWAHAEQTVQHGCTVSSASASHSSPRRRVRCSAHRSALTKTHCFGQRLMRRSKNIEPKWAREYCRKTRVNAHGMSRGACCMLIVVSCVASCTLQVLGTAALARCASIQEHVAQQVTFCGTRDPDRRPCCDHHGSVWPTRHIAGARLQVVSVACSALCVPCCMQGGACCMLR